MNKAAQAILCLDQFEQRVVQVQRMSPQTHPFRASHEGAPIFVLASIATITAIAATVITHSPPSSKPVRTSLESSLFMLWQDILHWLHTGFHLFWH
jgi:hypothetical protein